jgi:hypothetical protein
MFDLNKILTDYNYDISSFNKAIKISKTVPFLDEYRSLSYFYSTMKKNLRKKLDYICYKNTTIYIKDYLLFDSNERPFHFVV